MRIIFTGTQGTGKTTILNELKDLYPTITNVCRTLGQKGVKLNEMGDTESQAKIFDTYNELLKQNHFISDRGLSDVFGYSEWLEKNGKITKDELTREYDKYVDYINNYPAVYFYFPIEFPVENDGIRSVDEGFREEIDKNIHGNLLAHNIPFFTVRGSVEERLELITHTIDMYKKLETIKFFII